MAEVYRIFPKPVALADVLARRVEVIAELEAHGGLTGPVRPEQAALSGELDRLDSWIEEHHRLFPGCSESRPAKPRSVRRWARVS